VLSRSRQRFTFGDVGKLAFAITVDQIPQFFWQGEKGSGVPTHPVRQLLAHPHIFEFASPIGGTYPPAFDGGLLAGRRPRPTSTFMVSSPSCASRSAPSSRFGQMQLEYAVLLLALFLLRPPAARAWWKLFRPASLLVAAAACGLLQLRHCAHGIQVCSSFRSASMASGHLQFFCACARKVPGVSSSPSSSLPSAFTGLKAAKFTVSDVLAMRSGPRKMWIGRSRKRLRALLVCNRAIPLPASPASRNRTGRALAGVKIVAEIPLGDEDVFWQSSPEAKQKVFSHTCSHRRKKWW